MIKTEFKQWIENYDFDHAFEKTKSILMRLIESAYIWYNGMPDIVLECAHRLLELDNTHLRALQAIVDCYEHSVSHCTDEQYESAKRRMEELGYTMRS